MKPKKDKIICVIDDDVFFQHLTKRLIDKFLTGYQLLPFENGRLALDFSESNVHAVGNLPQLILVDINMPVMDGWQFLEEFRQLAKGEYKPIIYMSSSSSDQDDIDRANTYKQLRGYLTKPILMPQMSLLLSSAFDLF